MTREEIIQGLSYAPSQVFIDETLVELSKNVVLDINAIFDYFESELNEKNKEIARLRKQIARGHDVGCDCSFCKMPGFIYGGAK